MRDRSFNCNLRSNVPGIEDPHSWSWEKQTYPEWSQHDRDSLAATFGSSQREDRGWGFELPKYTWVLRIDRSFWPSGHKRRSSAILRRGGTRGFKAYFGWHVRGWSTIWMLYAKGHAKSLNEAARMLEPSFDLRESMIRLGKVIYDREAFLMCHPFSFGYKKNQWGWDVKDECSINVLGHGWMEREQDRDGVYGNTVLPIARDSFSASAVMIEKRIPHWWREQDLERLKGETRYPSFHWSEHGGHSSGPIGDIKTVTDFFASAIASSTIEAD